jgi:two-component system sensor histidine kinase/response regulator
MAIPLSPPLGRLLVVDDEVRLMNALCDTLRDKGYEVTGASSGSAALAVLREIPIDLLLTDLTMPTMDGIALLKAAREIDPQLVAIMMTGHGTIATAVEAMQLGAFDYILKPFKLSAVLPVLTRALAVRQLQVENAILQKRVSERTAELEAANKELEAFSGSVAHDLRAPLRAINGFAGMIQLDCQALLPAKSRKHLEQIITSAAQMNQLVEDLLKFARFSRLPLARRTVVMGDLVAKVLRELQAVPGNRPVAVKVGPLPDCQADAVLLQQVWVNLLANAFKFTRGKPAPLIEVGARPQPGEVVYFVRDNGAGFDMKHAAKLFGAFQRLHASNEFEGTGIGLSIVQRIIQRHGGRVWAEAKVGEGAAFYFTVPDAKART